MSTVEEVEYAINVLRLSKNTDFTILHCNTQYPTEAGGYEFTSYK